MPHSLLLNIDKAADVSGDVREYSMTAALRHWVLLIKLNALFVLFSLPLITLPAAYCATVDIMHDLLRDQYREPFMLARFSATFRGSFNRALSAGFIFACVQIICISSVYFYGVLATTHLFYSVFCAVAFALMVMNLLAACYFYTALSLYPTLTFRQLLKVALYSVLLKPWTVLLGISAVMLIWVAHLLTYPYSLFFPVFISLSIGVLILTFTSVKGVNLAFEMLHDKTKK